MRKSILMFALISLVFACSTETGYKIASDKNIGEEAVTMENEEENVEDTQTIAEETVEAFVSKFYASLELTKEENQEHYETGNIEFNLSEFNSLVAANADYSEERLENLSGGYHDRYTVELQEIDSILINSNEVVVYTKVSYSISEMGEFFNNERLVLLNQNEELKLSKWEDIGIYKMVKAEYEHMDNFTESDFYKAIGSFNK